MIALALYKAYFTNDRYNRSDLWNYLGYWRSGETAIRLLVDGKTYLTEPDLRDKANPAFVLNGTKIEFEIAALSGNCYALKINDQTCRISAIFENQNLLRISYRNRQHLVSFPGLLNNYPETLAGSAKEAEFESGVIQSPLHGKILKINIIENQIIKKGDLLLVIEAMKSENRILSPKDARVKKIAVNVGAQVTDRMPLLFLEDEK